MPNETNVQSKNLLNAYIPIGSVVAIVIALFTFYTHIESTLDVKFAAMGKKQDEFKTDVTAEVRTIREAFLRQHPLAPLPQPRREN